MQVPFISDNFLLNNKFAQELYHDFAKNMPIFDYHNHLSPKDIALDRKFKTITELWIEGDHYKWRAMRANGIDERYITGNASDYEKFEKWAETVPYTLKNPLYHWSHLELKNYFGIDELLNKENARAIYDVCNEKLSSDAYSVRSLLKRMNVKMVGTTDDPTDSLEYHQKLRNENFEIKVLPSFRPDKFVAIENINDFFTFFSKLENVVGFSITEYHHLLEALALRHTFFHENGCRVSDHGLSSYFFEATNKEEVTLIFEKLLKKQTLTSSEINKYKTYTFIELCKLNHSRNWVQQFHVGAIRNNNKRMFHSIGSDTGFDSLGSLNKAEFLSNVLNELNKTNQLTKTILYNLNPSESEMIAAMGANFNESPQPGKIQYGAAWWFLDQKTGIEAQLDVIANYGLLSRFVGMVTDSRSFLSFPRHEYFRRIVCNVLGQDIQNGILPNDIELIGQLIKDLCYNNAEKYFQI